MSAVYTQRSSTYAVNQACCHGLLTAKQQQPDCTSTSEADVGARVRCVIRRSVFGEECSVTDTARQMDRVCWCMDGCHSSDVEMPNHGNTKWLDTHVASSHEHPSILHALGCSTAPARLGGSETPGASKSPSTRKSCSSTVPHNTRLKRPDKGRARV